MENIDKVLRGLYYKHGLTSQKTLYYKAKQILKDSVSHRIIKIFVEKQKSHQITRGKPKKVQRVRDFTTSFGEVWQVDILDMTKLRGYNRGYKYILVGIDKFTRFGMVKALSNRKSENIIKALLHWFRLNGKPYFIQADNEFNKTVFKEFFDKYKIYAQFSPPYHSSVNGMVERLNRTIREILRIYFIDKNTLRWNDVIQDIIKMYNNRYHVAIKMTPEEGLSRPVELQSKVIDAMEREAHKHNVEPLRVGSKVRLLEELFRDSSESRIFDKHSTLRNWTEDTYIIYWRSKNVPYKYRVRGVKRMLYREQLLPVDKVEEEALTEAHHGKKQNKKSVRKDNNKSVNGGHPHNPRLNNYEKPRTRNVYNRTNYKILAGF